MSNTEDTPDTLQHFSAGDVNGARITEAPRHSSATGYGAKIPTPYMLQTFGPRPVWRRVYVINYGNAGSSYVLQGGARHYLTPGVELILETIRDGGTLEDARAKMTEWPEWMRAAEGLPVEDVHMPLAGDILEHDGREILVQFAEAAPGGAYRVRGRYVAPDDSIDELADITFTPAPAAPAEDIPARLEQLRARLEAEDISYGELVELQGLAAHITPGDVQLLEAAGVPEHPATEDAPALQIQPLHDTPLQRRIAAGHLQRTGHPLDAVSVSGDGVLWHTVRRCCGESVPPEVATWQDMTPAPDVPAFRVGQTVKLLNTHPGDGGWSSAYVESIAGSRYGVRVQGHSLYWVTAAALELIPEDAPPAAPALQAGARVTTPDGPGYVYTLDGEHAGVILDKYAGRNNPPIYWAKPSELQPEGGAPMA
jgi:hypothetical protein